MIARRAVVFVALFAFAFFAAPFVQAQCVSLTTLGSAATQNFDTLSNTAGSTTNNLTITGWFLTEGGGGARDNEQYAVDTGGSTTGDMYSYGAAGSTERALGQLRSGTLIPLFGACYTNNTGATITSLDIAYNGEEWRLGTAARTDQMNFEYSLNATDLVTGTWTNVAALNFVTPDTATTGAKNGNAAADRTAKSASIPSLSIANGATFWIRWNDIDASGADDGLAVDDFSLTPQGGVATPNLTINDVSLNEGNAGTTSFTFTVSLSAPAGAGGVTFDIATADGTGTQPSDYTQKSLTGQTIPAGSSTYSFTVLVNGDSTPETNETFFVNVTNATGANVTDGQGQGTIQNDDIAPNLTINDVSLSEGNAGTTTFSFTVSLSAPAPAGGVTFDIATADGTATQPGDYTQKSLTSQTIPAGSSTYNFDVLVNGDITAETNETFFVNVTNITNAIGTDTQGQGTINNDDITKIHDVQGNGSASPIVGSTVTVEGIVVGDYQGSTQLSGFFLQEEDADVDADPATSEGIFIFCNTCPTAVAEGQRVKVTGSVSEFFNMTEITGSTAGAVVITDAGNNLAQVTPSTVDLPVVGDVNTFYETREGMLVTFVDTLSISEYFEEFRYGQIELYEGGRPRQYAEMNPPNTAGYTAHLDNLDRRRVILDDDDNIQNVPLTLPDGSQYVYHPTANGGLSVGTQGVDFFRGGDTVTNLTGVLDWSFAGLSGTEAWRLRPMSQTASSFTVVNPRPATAPNVGGAIKVVSMNMLNYFTTIDTTSSNNTGTCGPSGTQDCRGADSVAELTRQRERASIVLCDLNPDVAGLVEVENTTPSNTITDLLGAVNTRCGGAHPYAFANTGGTLGTDAIRVFIIYRTGVVSPVGAPMVDLDPVHNRPPTAQTFDVVDATNPAFGERFTIVANHFKSKGSCPGSGLDADQNDGAGCWNPTRTAQANELLSWVNGTVIPAAGDPDVVLVGDFNAYAQEPPVTTIEAAGYTDTEEAFLGANAYSYLFDGQLGHIDYAFTSASLTPQVTGVSPWHINADENPLFDYNDEIKDTGENQAFEEKPDGSALTPPRVVFQPGTPYRAADHDPVLLGLFAVSDLAISKTDAPDPVIAGNNLAYAVMVTNNGPDAAANASWTDTLPAGVTFVSLTPAAGWSCTTPAIGAGGTITCSTSSMAVTTDGFSYIVNVSSNVAAGTVLSNTATVTSNSAEGSAGNESSTTTTTVATSADLGITKTDSPDPVNAGSNVAYAITLTNNGPSDAANASWTDTLPAGTTFVSLAQPGGWSCTTPAVGAAGTVTCSIASMSSGSAMFTLTVKVDPSTAAGTVLSNTATASSSTTDPTSGNDSATETTTVAASADLSVTKTDTPDPVIAGNLITYTVTVTNAGPSNATNVTLTDTIPAGTTFAFLAAPGAWVCPVPNASGPVVCTHSSLPVGTSVFTIKVVVDPATASGTVLTNSVQLTSDADPNGANDSDSVTTTVSTSADLSVTKTDTPDPVNAGNLITYTVTVTNAGPSNADSVTLTDTTPPGTTFAFLAAPGAWVCPVPAASGPVVCTHASLPVGTSVFTIKVIVDPATAAGTMLTNTVQLTTSTADPNTGNESASATTTVATSADVQITKVDTPDPVTAGNSLTYTITATNVGPSDAQNATIADTLPAGTTFVSLAPAAGWSCTSPSVGGTGTVNCSIAQFPASGTASFTLVVATSASLTNGSTITNTATAGSSTTDPTPANNSATATTTVGTGSADLSITKTDSPDPITAGQNLTYTIAVTNAGPSNATTASWTDTLPAGTTFISLSPVAGWSCTTPAVGANGTVTCSNASFGVTTANFTLVVSVDAGVLTNLSNTATVSAATTDPNGANNSATATTTVNASADVQITKVDTPDPVNAGTNLTYTINVTNAGPSDAQTVSFTDTLPTGTTFVSLSPVAGWSCTTPAVGGTGAVNCSTATLDAGANAAFTLVVAVGAGVSNGTVITNTATVASTTADPTPANNSATATTTVGAGSADLSVTKTDSPDPVSAGQNLTYTITVTNAGPSNATSASLSDTLPANTTFVSLTPAASWSCTTPAVGATGTVTCNNASFGVTSGVFTLVVNVNPATAGGTILTNTATVTSSTTDPATGNESATTTTAVSSPTMVRGTKSVTGSFTPGGSITYTIVLTNTGTVAQMDNPGNEFIDVLPAQLTLVDANATSGTALATVGTNTVTWNGSIAGGASVTITIHATVRPDATPGTMISNQGTISYDADGNGTNETTGSTDSASAPGSSDPTTFVLAAATANNIPTLDEWALIALAAMLAMVAVLVMKR